MPYVPCIGKGVGIKIIRNGFANNCGSVQFLIAPFEIINKSEFTEVKLIT